MCNCSEGKEDKGELRITFRSSCFQIKITNIDVLFDYEFLVIE